MNKLRVPHPATMYLLLTLAVIVLSWLSEVYGLSVVQDGQVEALRVQSLLSPEGIRWMLRHVVTNFTGFAPLGWVVMALFGIGVAVHSGFLGTLGQFVLFVGTQSYNVCRDTPWSVLSKLKEYSPFKNIATQARYATIGRIRMRPYILYQKHKDTPGCIPTFRFRERRALMAALVAIVPYALLVWFTADSSWAILRGVDGGLARSPFMAGLPFLLSLGIGLMGMVYGFAAGRYRTDSDVVDGLLHFARLLGVYVVVTFFASQMFACMDYSRLSLCFPNSASFLVIRFFTLFMPYMPLLQTFVLLYAPQRLCTAFLRITWWLTLVWALSLILWHLSILLI